MIKILEKDLLEDNFIISSFTDNISIDENIYFNKKETKILVSLFL